MRKTLLSFLTVLSILSVHAGSVSGIITDDKGHPLPYASVLVKGTTKGTTANNEGKYFLELDPGNYTIVAQHVGYNRVEKKITLDDKGLVLNFELSLLQLSLKEVWFGRVEKIRPMRSFAMPLRNVLFHENPLDYLPVSLY
jgi:hypothetical protein